MDKELEELKEATLEILYEEFIVKRSTHENPPPGIDCADKCNVSLDDQIAAANPICSPMRSGGEKHERCVVCWEEYLRGLIDKLRATETLTLRIAVVEKESKLPMDLSKKYNHTAAKGQKALLLSMLRAGWVKERRE